jgi:hypothetical protein
MPPKLRGAPVEARPWSDPAESMAPPDQGSFPRWSWAGTAPREDDIQTHAGAGHLVAEFMSMVEARASERRSGKARSKGSGSAPPLAPTPGEREPFSIGGPRRRALRVVGLLR